jgi:NADH-quinone oxidoreductase subunit N
MLALLQATTDLQAIARQTVQLIMPEVILTLFACGALVLDVLLPRHHKRWVAWTCLAGLGFAFISLGILYTDIVRKGLPRVAFFEMIVLDNYAVMFKAILLIGAALSVLLSIKYLETEGEQRGEYYALILFSVIGMMFMASSVDLLSLFISLELMAVSVYILVGYLRRDKKSNEAAMKYFLLGAFSSGVLLYGISLIYGLTGTTNLAKIAAALPVVATSGFNPFNTSVAADMRYLVLMAMILMAAGMFFKIAAVPFHMWAPDAYEGAPTPVTAFMSVAVKTASFAMFGRVFLYGLPDLRNTIAGDPASNIPALPGWALLLGVVAAITIVWGNLAAMRQENMKRLLAYSSISHAGYTLTGLVAGNERGYIGFILYMLVYTLTNIGVFGCIIALRRRGIVGDRLQDLNGLMKKAPGLAVMMTLFLLSLGGIPATAGFMGKFYLFGALIETGNPWLVRLAILAVVMSVVSFYYYFRFIRAMYIEAESEPQPVRMTMPLRVALVVTALLVIFIGVYPQPVINITQRAAASPGFRTFNYQQANQPAQSDTKAKPAPSDRDNNPMGVPPR